VAENKIWAITSYFNPIGYKSRSRNYDVFRKYLEIPLITVELSSTGQFELSENDADVLIQIQEGDVMFQKERLLNIALSRIPPDTQYIAWIDCDVCIEAGTWTKAVSALNQYSLVQLFSELHDLPRNSLPSEKTNIESQISLSAGRRFVEGTSAYEICSPPFSRSVTRMSTGIAWISHASILKRHSFYDAFVIGGGDRALLHAALGEFEQSRVYARLNDSQWKHYLEWARCFYDEVRGNVGYVDTTVFHLWHGSSVDRQYRDRYESISKFRFDPFNDIHVNSSGSWSWNSEKPEMHSYLVRYFSQRLEDD